MAEAYDLDRALATCDTLASPVGRDGCHQGVFMENVNAAMRGSSRAGLFSREDPLAPCNSLPEHYRHECYLNHAGWLVGVVFPHGVGEASARCLDAGAFIGPCMESIGLMVTNPAWQASLTAPGVPGEFDAETRASELCGQFPPAWQHSCVRGAVDNVLNFDELDISRAARFCALVPDILADTCFETIGRNVARQARTEKTAREICGSPVSIRASAACLRGAGL